MKIETKYSIGEHVYCISKGKIRKYEVLCISTRTHLGVYSSEDITIHYDLKSCDNFVDAQEIAESEKLCFRCIYDLAKFWGHGTGVKL